MNPVRAVNSLAEVFAEKKLVASLSKEEVWIISGSKVTQYLVMNISLFFFLFFQVQKQTSLF